MAVLSKVWGFVKGEWVSLVFVALTAFVSIGQCSYTKQVEAQRDAALLVVQRQQDLAHKLDAAEKRADDAHRLLEEAEARADEADQLELDDLYERFNAEGSAAGVLNALIYAGELP